MITETLRRALSAMPYGLYVVGSRDSTGVAVIVANWVMQVSFKPALLAVSIESGSRMKGVIEQS
jgi:flavin reductase (DIM6/NTAB) family NADH-FMN oxidoreductase RutF